MNLYDQVQDHEDRIVELEGNEISTNMDVNTLSNLTTFMQGVFWYTGQVTLISGVATLVLPSVTVNSFGLVTGTSSTGNQLSIACTNGVATITSSSGTDSTLVNYLIFI